MTRRMGPATPLADLLEKEWDSHLFGAKIGLATTLGWKLVYHTLRSKGSRSGFPDRVLIRDRVIFAELKTEKGVVSDTQAEWLTGLAKAGAEVYLWRPSDLEEIGEVLARRWRREEGGPQLSPAHRPLALHDGRSWWTPASLWLPDGHRHDQQQELTAA